MGRVSVAERAARPARVSEPFINLAGVQKTYRMGRMDYPALRGIDLETGSTWRSGPVSWSPSWARRAAARRRS
jgi:hypothetical protein